MGNELNYCVCCDVGEKFRINCEFSYGRRLKGFLGLEMKYILEFLKSIA